MKTFTDTQNRTWTLNLTLGMAMAIKARCGMDLLQPELGDPPAMTRLGTDEYALGEVLLVLLEGQLEASGLDADGLRAAFDGKTLLAAQSALYDELIDFFRMRGRGDRAKAIEKQKATIEAAIETAQDRVEALSVSEAVREAFETAGTPSGSSPAPSA